VHNFACYTCCGTGIHENVLPELLDGVLPGLYDVDGSVAWSVPKGVWMPLFDVKKDMLSAVARRPAQCPLRDVAVVHFSTPEA
jgi:hypothetical protein